MPNTDTPVEDFATEIEDSRHLFAWCLVHYGQVPEAQALEQARKRYPDQNPGREYEHALIFHDEPWHWAMLHVKGEGYWQQHPELAHPSLHYEAESDALCLARGEQVPLLDEDEYLGALAHARHMRAWTLVHQAGRSPDEARQEALGHYAYHPRHHRGRLQVHDPRDGWCHVMSTLHGNDYWSRPELREPPQAYWSESRAFVSVQGIRLPDPPG
ncbi:hypothetical protein [Stenotrophomonas maltophilia]|uniref:hypothetical protein n=1 Tax=Stenotrophomonas maltophilia TaxID=40324 RepID=UPI001D11EB0C|nr:hypothetical protein [Stenotrophomonas maltophilia]UXB35774.1 hypothetical protein K7563_17885 [Stenotrophomonas maltophilia]